jgi:PD-(D/E)XK nuclease family transposase
VTPLDAWCYFLKHAADIDTDHWPATMSGPAMLQAKEVLKMISQTELERERYLERERAERDEISYRAEARLNRERLQDAQEKIRQWEEITRNAQISLIHLCQQMLKLPLTTKEELAAVSLDELSSLAEDLKKRCESPGT